MAGYGGRAAMRASAHRRTGARPTHSMKAVRWSHSHSSQNMISAAMTINGGVSSFLKKRRIMGAESFNFFSRLRVGNHHRLPMGGGIHAEGKPSTVLALHFHEGLFVFRPKAVHDFG